VSPRFNKIDTVHERRVCLHCKLPPAPHTDKATILRTSNNMIYCICLTDSSHRCTGRIYHRGPIKATTQAVEKVSCRKLNEPCIQRLEFVHFDEHFGHTTKKPYSHRLSVSRYAGHGTAPSKSSQGPVEIMRCGTSATRPMTQSCLSDATHRNVIRCPWLRGGPKCGESRRSISDQDNGIL